MKLKEIACTQLEATAVSHKCTIAWLPLINWNHITSSSSGQGTSHVPCSPAPSLFFPYLKVGPKRSLHRNQILMMGCAPQLCLLACHGRNSLQRSRKEKKKNIKQKSMDHIRCLSKIINRRKMKLTHVNLPGRVPGIQREWARLLPAPRLLPQTTPTCVCSTQHLGDRRDGVRERGEQGDLRVSLTLVPILLAGSSIRNYPSPWDLHSNKREISE